MMKKYLEEATKFALYSVIFLAFIAGGFGLTEKSVAAEEVIKIGSVADVSGPTSETGTPFALGVRTYFNYINGKGGVNGRKIELLETDGAYSIPKETAAFKRYAMEGVVAFIAYSTGGHSQIVKMAARDKIVIFGAGLAEGVVKGEPWAFMHAASYDQVWRGEISYQIDHFSGRKPKMAIIYPDNGWGIMNRDASRAYAGKRGIEIVDEGIIAHKELDATTTLLTVKKRDPDFIMASVGTQPVSCVVMRDAKKIGIDTKKVQFYVPIQGIGPLTLEICGATVEDMIGGASYSSWDEKDLPGIKLIRQVVGEGKAVDPWFIHGWTCAMVLTEGIRGIGSKKATSENLKEALESVKNFDTGGITPPISFTPEDHLGAKGIKLFKANIAKNYFEPIGDWVYAK